MPCSIRCSRSLTPFCCVVLGSSAPWDGSWAAVADLHIRRRENRTVLKKEKYNKGGGPRAPGRPGLSRTLALHSFAPLASSCPVLVLSFPFPSCSVLFPFHDCSWNSRPFQKSFLYPDEKMAGKFPIQKRMSFSPSYRSKRCSPFLSLLVRRRPLPVALDQACA